MYLTTASFLSVQRISLIKIVHIKLHLAKVGVRQLDRLEVDEHVTFEDRVIEDEIHVEMISVEREPFLTGNECKALAQF